MAYLTCKHLTIGYEGNAVLSDINISVSAGDYLAVIGENGSGKTTLMKTILGLKTPLSGEIRFGDGLKKNEIGYLPQQTGIQKDFPATVWEVVLSGCQARASHRPFYNQEEKALAHRNIARMGLQALEKRCYRNLSGGQQQRVLLARALCATQKMLVLDEPVSGLDPRVTAELYALIRTLNQEDGIAVVMITHDLSEALQEAKHILHIGRDIFFGSKEEYFASPFLKNFYVETGGADI